MEYSLVKFIKDDLNLEVIISPYEETIWLSRDDMSILFNRDRSVIGKHIRNLLKTDYAKNSVWAKIARTGSDGKEYDVDYFNLDIVLAIGNKIKSKNGLLLKKFLKEYLDNYYKKEKNTIIMYNNGNISLPVTISPYEETVWLNKEQLVLLFDTTRQNVEYHIENIFSQAELEEGATCKDFLQVQIEGGRKVSRSAKIYNLDLIISLGYRINTKNGILFRKWATRVLKQFLLKGYAIDENRTLVTDDNYVNLINMVNSMNNRLQKIENESIYFPHHLIIENGKLFNAYIMMSDIVSKAKNSIVLIDPYTDSKTLNVIKNKNDGTSILIITSDKTKISQQDIKLFNNDYGGLSLLINNNYHDRYLIIDDYIYYHLGSSINYLGNKFSQIDKIDDEDIKELLRNRINEQKQKRNWGNN